jgi:hypothetical protein
MEQMKLPEKPLPPAPDTELHPVSRRKKTRSRKQKEPKKNKEPKKKKTPNKPVATARTLAAASIKINLYNFYTYSRRKIMLTTY